MFIGNKLCGKDGFKHWHGDLTGLMLEARNVSEKLQKKKQLLKEKLFPPCHILFLKSHIYRTLSLLLGNHPLLWHLLMAAVHILQYLLYATFIVLHFLYTFHTSDI